MQVLLDVNVLADAYLGRQPFDHQANLILQANRDRKLRCYIAAFTVPTLFYIIYRDLVSNVSRGQATTEAFKYVRACIKAFRVCPLTYEHLKQALMLPGEDFEDNLQITCALSADLNIVVTRDKRFSSGNITVRTPAQLIKQRGL